MSSIQFSKLKRSEIRRIIERGDCIVEIYNPTKEQRKEILTMLITNYDAETNQMNLSDIDVIKGLIPMLTNIHLDIENDKSVEDIIADPSEVLLDVQEELADIVQEVIKRFINHLKGLNKLPEQSLEQILKSYYMNDVNREE